MTTHALVSASAFAGLMECPGRPAFIDCLSVNAKIREDIVSPAAIEGTLAHHVVEQYMLDPLADLPAMLGESLLDEAAKAGIVTTQEMIDTALSLGAWQAEQYPTARVQVEARVCYGDALGVPDTQAFGTADLLLIDPANGRIGVVDLKYGAGRYVDENENAQMRLYALGALAGLPAEERDAITQVEMTIYQPRMGEGAPRTHVETVEALNEWAATVARPAAARVLSASESLPDGAFPTRDWQRQHLSPGDHACTWCPAKVFCTPYTEAVFDDVEQPETQAETIDTASDALLVEAYRRTSRAVDWARAVQAEVRRRMIDEGRPLPGLRVVEGRMGARKWIDEEAALAALVPIAEKVGVDPAQLRAGLKSPAQVEKLLPAPARKRIVELVQQKPTAPTIQLGDAASDADASDFTPLD